MHPDLFTIPGLNINVKTYGFFLMVGFLGAVWLAMRRAARVKADPDRVLDASFYALFFGVGGARLFFVIHYWQTDFAHRPNKLLAIIDIRQGGLEFLGGLLGAMGAILIFLWVKKLSIRMYMDVLAPGAMWGLAFGRLGCFFNGCCFGGLCVAGQAGEAPQYPWAARFPYGSPAHVRQWEDRLVTVPAELINTKAAQPYLLPATALSAPIERIQGPQRDVERLEKALAKAKEDKGDEKTVEAISAQLASAKASWEAVRREYFLDDLEWAQKFPSRVNPKRATSISELQRLAESSLSLPVHPTQLYAATSAAILTGLLSCVFYRRKRHGVVIGLLIVLYPICRVFEEIIRADNPLDTAGMTVSQFISLLMFLSGLAYLFVLYRVLPERSPKLAATAPPG